MNIAVVGYNGYIGSHVCDYLRDRGHVVVGIGRSVLFDKNELRKSLEYADAVCCFTGYPIINRWTKANKKKIWTSRIGVIETIAKVIKEGHIELDTFVSASAMGLYDDYVFSNETSKYDSKGFMSDLIEAWEKIDFSGLINRMINLRIGVVLGKGSGYLQKLKIPWMLGFTPVFNRGKTNFGFIHIEDLCRVVEFCIENKEMNGIVNAISPEVNKEYRFHDELKRIFKLFLPGVIARVIFGKAAQLILRIPKVIPEKLLKHGYSFRYEGLKEVIPKL